MNNQLVDELVLTIKRNTPEGENMLNTLMNVLSLGKEAIYRRLRGEVQFTFEEVVKLSLRFNISLDEIAGIGNLRRAVFDIGLQDPVSSFYDSYIRNLESYIQTLKTMNQAKKARLRCAVNTLPFIFMLSRKNLSRFRLYKWVYQMQKLSPDFSFSEMKISALVEKSESSFISEIKRIERIYYIFDNNVFTSMVDDINYFYKSGLLTPDEFRLLKEDFISLIDELETITINGTFENGGEIEIYLSETNFDSSYIHCEYDHHQQCILKAYMVNLLGSRNSEICHIQKDWIESLKRYSILITKSSENRRNRFIKKQKDLIDKMGN